MQYSLRLGLRPFSFTPVDIIFCFFFLALAASAT